MTLLPLDGHQPGHAGIALGEPWEVLCCGHLFVDPTQVLALERPGLDQDVATAADTRRSVLERATEEGFGLLGPLWPEPGVAHVVRGDGGAFELRAVAAG